jgi:hypothetical protein
MNKPHHVKYAEVILWTTLVITLGAAVAERSMGVTSPESFYLSLFATVLCSVLPYKIGQGRNWARITYAGLSVLGYAALFAGETDGASATEVVLSWAQIPLDVAIAYFLFRPESNAWFRAARP